MMKELRVLSRDGKEIRKYDLSKIEAAVKKAFDATETVYNSQIIEAIAVKATNKAGKKATRDGDARYINDAILTVEGLQDGVVKALYSMDYDVVADAYTKYRKVHADARSIIDAATIKAVYNYTGEMDDSDPLARNNNASQTISISGLHQYLSGEDEKNFWQVQYDRVDPAIREGDQDNDGRHYIHDYTLIAPYCCGWSLGDLIQTGIPSVGGTTAAGPAKHLDTLCVQMVNFLGILQSEAAGAQAFSSFDTYLAPFLKADCESDFEYTYKRNNGDFEGAAAREYAIAEKAIQKFVYGVNVPSRWGSLPPFSNITLDWARAPKDMAEKPCIVGGKDLVINGKTIYYKDVKHEMDVINHAFLKTMVNGDAEGRGHQYPIPSYSITKDFDWSETENNKLLFEMTARYGTPNFMNYVNSEMDPTDVRSMCCRLRLDLRKLRRKAGGNFGAGENTGSIGVVTINLPLLAYRSESRDHFFQLVKEEIRVAVESLNKKREVLQHYMALGLYPYIKFYLRKNGEGTELKNHFSTVGVVGMNEMCLNIKWEKFGNLVEEKSRKFTEEVLDFFRNELADYQMKNPEILYNLEATPAESTAHKLARNDKRRYPDIITAGTDDAPYYTNSSHLPVGAVDDVFDALDMQDPLQVKYTSGTIFHTFLGERLPDWKAAASLVRAIASNYKLPTFTLSPTYSICPNHGYIAGEHFTCPDCGRPAQVFSRITGYYRPVENFNNGKKQEFGERALFDGSASKAPAKMQAVSVAETADTENENPVQAEMEDRPIVVQDQIIILSTKTCGKCEMVKKLLAQKGIPFTNIYGEDPEGQDLAKKLGVEAVPVLIIGDEVLTDFAEIIAKAKTL